MIIHRLEEIDSTNEQAKRLAAEGAPHETLILADRQTAGKGRRGRSWESATEGNLYFSLILRPEIVPDKASMLTLVMALAVAKALQQTIQVSSVDKMPLIKWPNDIVIAGKKVCGILTELTLKGQAIDAVVIGVGVNIRKQDFAPELLDKATDLETEWSICFDREELLQDIMTAFRRYYAIFLEKESLTDLREEYNALLVNRDREVCVLDPAGEFRGNAIGINEKGELHIRLLSGDEVDVYAGEVSVRGIYGYV